MTRVNSKILKALLEAGAIRRAQLIAEGSLIRIEVETQAGPTAINTLDGKLKTWGTVDAAARWQRTVGIGTCQLDFNRWQPSQKGMKL